MRTFLKSLFFSLMAILYIGQPTVALAQRAVARPTPTTTNQEQPGEFRRINLPTFVANNQVTLDQMYPGAVFATGGQVTLTGDVAGDLVVAGGTVVLDGHVGQDVYATGGTVIIRGTVDGNVVAAGGEVRLEPTAVVEQSLIVAGEAISLAGTVNGGSWIGSSKVKISGTLRGDTEVEVGTLEVGSMAQIGGEIRGRSSDPVKVDENSTPAGRINVTQTDRVDGKKVAGAAGIVAGFVAINWAWVTITILGKIALIALLIKLFPKLLQRGSEVVAKSPVHAFVVGTTFLVFMPVLLILLTISILGLPIAIFGLGLYLAVFWLGWIFPALWLGSLLLPKQEPMVQGIAAVTVLSLVGAVPVVGWIGSLLVGILGAGTLLVWWGKERV